jgi:hypothetical protein
MATEFKVGDECLFDHFGSKDRQGHLVKVTRTKVHIAWTAPSSGLLRIVAVGLIARPPFQATGILYTPDGAIEVAPHCKLGDGQ